MSIVVTNIIDDNIDGQHNITIEIATLTPITSELDKDLMIVVEHELMMIFSHDYNIFINGKTVDNEFVTEFINNMISQISNLSVKYRIGHNCSASIMLVQNNIIIEKGLTKALVDVMF